MGRLFSNLKKKLPVFLFVVFAVGLLFYIIKDSDGEKPKYRLIKAEEGSIVSTVSCTGALGAVITVKVGSQVSGQIKELLADFNSEVEKGEVIARIDPENFQARLRQSEAELAVARANVTIKRAAVKRSRAELQNARNAYASAQAQTEKFRVSLADARRDYDRKKKLHKGSIISESEKDKAEAAYDQAQAQLNSAEAEEKATASFVVSKEAALRMAEAEVQYALAQVNHREAAVQNSKVDLGHTIIRSPVDGVVIERNVDMGQTVAASLQAPTLFTIAQDLRKMQVETDIDEADIGRIHEGQQATFTVDAFADREFGGRVEQIRKAPQTLQNVVTYTVIISAENSALLLLPGMTANVKVVVDERKQVLKVPNAALRFRPSKEANTKESTENWKISGPIKRKRVSGEEIIHRLDAELKLNKEQKEQIRILFGEMRDRITRMRRQGAGPDELRAEFQRLRERNKTAVLGILTPEQREKYKRLLGARAATPRQRGQIWVIGPDGKPSSVDVITGISDGSHTEILRGDLRPGQEVIVGTVLSSGRLSGGSKRFGF